MNYKTTTIAYFVAAFVLVFGISSITHAQAISGEPSPGNPYGLVFDIANLGAGSGFGNGTNNGTGNGSTSNGSGVNNGNGSSGSGNGFGTSAINTNGSVAPAGTVLAEGILGPDGQPITSGTIDENGNLLDENGNIIATGVTDPNGNPITNATILPDGTVVSNGPDGSSSTNTPPQAGEVLSEGLYGPNGELITNATVDADGNVIDENGNILMSGATDEDGNPITNASIGPDGRVISNGPNASGYPEGTLLASNLLDANGNPITNAVIDSKGRIIKNGKIIGQNVLDKNGRIIRNAIIDKKGRVIASGTPIHMLGSLEDSMNGSVAASANSTGSRISTGLWMLFLMLLGGLIWLSHAVYIKQKRVEEKRDELYGVVYEDYEYETLDTSYYNPLYPESGYVEYLDIPQTLAIVTDDSMESDDPDPENEDYVTYRPQRA